MTGSRRLAAHPWLAGLALACGLALAGLASPARAADRDAAPDTAQSHRYYRAGADLLAAGRPIEALRQFQNASIVDPEDSEVHYAQGLCLLRLDEPAKARAQFERALDRAPDHAGAQYELGLALVALDDTAGARTHLLRASALDRRMPGVHRALAHLAEKGGDAAGAYAELGQERAVSPDS